LAPDAAATTEASSIACGISKRLKLSAEHAQVASPVESRWPTNGEQSVRATRSPCASGV
jgi:hypothetical protein